MALIGFGKLSYSHRIRQSVVFSFSLLLPLAALLIDVLTQHNDLARTGANLKETVLTPANVNEKQFGMLFKHVVDDQVYSQPLLVTNVKIGGGWHDVVYVTTVNNSVYAFDANNASAPFWHVNFGTPAWRSRCGFRLHRHQRQYGHYRHTSDQCREEYSVRGVTDEGRG